MQTVQIVQRGKYGRLDLMGPTVEFLALPQEEDSYCVLVGTIPPGVVVPLHSHPDPESFFQLSGAVQVFSQRDGHFEWLDVQPGEFVDIPGRTKHAFRNESPDPVVQLITTTPNLGRFFQEIGRPVTAEERLRPPTPVELQRFAIVAADYGYWLGDRLENAAIGIAL
jgi:quercetin dioxygenase-like cupin family protein